MNYKNRSLMALAFVAVTGSAFAQQTLNIPGTVDVVGGFNDPANVVTSIAGAVPNNYVLRGTLVTINSGSYAQVNTSMTPNAVRVRLRNSAYPNAIYDFSTSTSTSTAASLVLGAVNLTPGGTLLNTVIPAGSTWTAELFNNLSVLPGTDATMTNLTFTLIQTFPLATNVLQSFDLVASNGGLPIDVFGTFGTLGNAILTIPDTISPTDSFVVQSIRIEEAVINKPATTLKNVFNHSINITHSNNFSLLSRPAIFNTVNDNNWSTFRIGNRQVEALYPGSNLFNTPIPGGGTWSFEPINLGDAVADLDATWSTLKLRLNGLIASPPVDTLAISSPVDIIDTPGDPNNNLVNIGTTTNAFTLSDNCYTSSSGTMVSSTANVFAANKVRIYNSAYQFDYVEFGYNGAALTFTLAEAFGGFAFTGSLVNKAIPAGSTWTAEFASDTDDAALATQIDVKNTGVAAGTYNSFVFKPTNAAYVPPSAPAVAVDLGTLVGGSYTASLPNFVLNGLKYVKFTIPQIDKANSQWIDIWTQPQSAAAAPTRVNDTFAWIYDEGGRLIQRDNNDGPGVQSAFSFGLGDVDARAPKTTTSGDTWGPSKRFNGRDGNGLAAGTYYVAVANFNAGIGGSRGFGAFSLGGPSAAGTSLRIQMGTGKITGNVALPDWLASLSIVPMAWELLDSADAVVASGTTGLSASGDYSILTTVPTGSYTLTMKGSHWLKEGVAVTVGGNVSGINFSLLNGDADGDNFIGLDDFNVLSNSFNLGVGDPGYAANADFDGDDFVGLDDFNILSNNFNLGGYGS